MVYVEADNLKSAKRKAVAAIRRFNKNTNFPNRAIDRIGYVKKGLYFYNTRERKTRKDYKGKRLR